MYDLTDAGQSAVEIAQELDEQTGKVELILALRETQVTKDSYWSLVMLVKSIV